MQGISSVANSAYLQTMTAASGSAAVSRGEEARESRMEKAAEQNKAASTQSSPSAVAGLGELVDELA